MKSPAMNHEAAGNPGLITSDPYGQGWLFKLKLTGTSLSHLMDLQQYEEHVHNEEGH